MIVDAHHHLWRRGDGNRWRGAPELAPIRRSFTAERLRDEFAAAGVERSILVEAGRCDAAEARLLLGYADAVPEIAGVVVWADPTDAALPDLLMRYRALPGGERMVGVRPQIQGEADPDYLDRADVHNGLRTIGAAGLVFDLIVRVDQLPAAGRAAAALPEVRFVLNHLGKPRIRDGAAGLARWREAVAGLAARPNVAAKLSGLVTEADWASWTIEDLRPYVAAAVELFGPDRLMFGSDWPVCLLAAEYGAVKAALTDALPALSAEARVDIFGRTATRVYALPV